MSECVWQRAIIERLRREALWRYLTPAERDVCRALVQRFAVTGELSPALGKLLTQLLGTAVARRGAQRHREVLHGSRNGDGP
jgi:hypothetical protein